MENKKFSEFNPVSISKDTYKIPILDGLANKIVNWLVLKNDAVTEAVSQLSSIFEYDTGWIKNELGGIGVGDWTNVELDGSDGTTEGTITHNLNVPLADCLAKFFISTDGTDANSFEVPVSAARSGQANTTLYHVNDNELKLQTGSDGVYIINDSGGFTGITNQSYYYRLKVYTFKNTH